MANLKESLVDKEDSHVDTLDALVRKVKYMTFSDDEFKKMKMMVAKNNRKMITWLLQ